MKFLLFTGAGASVELGVPSMRPLVAQFRDHLEEQNVDQQVIDKISDRISDSNFDMENLVEDLDKMDQGQDTLGRWGESIEHPMEPHISVVRAEAEWFIQYICERIQKSAATTLWRSTLREISDHDVVIATTNYDRAIEVASSRMDVDLSDGFSKFEQKEWVSWTGFEDFSEPLLLKLHGSTDWYLSQGDDDNVWKLRHPMPVWGEVTLNVSGQEEIHLESAAVLPSREKKVRHPPYPELNAKFREHALDSEFAIFLGTSLRDPEIRDIFQNCASRFPTFLVNPSPGLDIELSLDDATVLQQSASRFLISTLPAALKSENTIETLESHANKGNTSEIIGTFSGAHNPQNPKQLRLDAIDDLAGSRVSLVKDDILPLLEANDIDIQKYSLALIQKSPDSSELLDIAEDIASSNPDTEFSEEFEILRGILN